MYDYQSFDWSEAETLSEEYRAMLIQRLQKQQRFGLVAFATFLLLLASPFLLTIKSDTPHGGWTVVFILTLFIGFVSALIYPVGRKRIKRVEAGDFVWRIGEVTATSRGGKHRRAYSRIDNQTVPYVLGAAVGDTVLVIGFNTAPDSKSLATFYATPIKT